MAKMILGYGPEREILAGELKTKLVALGHTVWMDIEFFSADRWEDNFVSKLTDADAFVAVATPEDEAGILASEAGLALGYASSSGRLATVAAIAGEGETPAFLKFFREVRAQPDETDAMATKITDVVAEWMGRRIAEDRKTEEVVKRIEENSADYVNEALQEQRSQARRNRLVGSVWYGIGFLSLLAAAAVVLVGAITEGASAKTTMASVSALLHGIVAVGILAACAKFGFALGKSFTSEAMKNLDRIHAISFGKFYLQAYGKTATWQELKEVFQNWNLDRTSSFHSLDTSQIDPNIATSMGQAVKELISKT